MRANHDIWIFGYGSLIWRPGFRYLEAVTGRLHGFHRRLCVWSHVYRGSSRNPGLVLGLDRGGSCRGLAYRVDPGRADAVRTYLHERELIYGIYRPIELTITLMGNGRKGDRVRASTYVVDQTHPQYAAGLDDSERAAVVIRSTGSAGRCRDYLASTVEGLNALGMPDHRLMALQRRVDEIDDGPFPVGEPGADQLHRE